MTKINFDFNCQEFYTFLKDSPRLLKQIISNKL